MIRQPLLILICLLGGVVPFFAQKNATTPRIDTVRIPGSEVSFRLAAIPAGDFLMGSPTAEAGRDDDEGPQRRVVLDSFWVGVCEVTYDEFVLFQIRQKDNDTALDSTFRADAVARPSPPYFDFTYGRGKQGGYPATTMTQQAALRYCQWLSDKTGHFYRLPTEAEWEYTCRAGTTTPYFFGSNAKKLPDYAWFYDNSKGSYQIVGTKKPNPWGLHDTYGNAAEWTLDAYAATYLAAIGDTTQLYAPAAVPPAEAAFAPWVTPIRKHSRTVRGGSFEDFAEDCRSAERRKSEPKWQARDPQIPKSKWWNPDSPFLGFRLVRDPRPLTKAQRDAFFAKAIRD
jgi:formylglycine-generating enzyme required for sulfatase activity